MYKARSEKDLCDGKNKALMRLMGRQWSKAEVGRKGQKSSFGKGDAERGIIGVKDQLK